MNNLELNRYLDIMHPNAKGQKIVFKLLTIVLLLPHLIPKTRSEKKNQGKLCQGKDFVLTCIRQGEQ